MELINENTNSEYEIDDEGYLTARKVDEDDENGKKINELINSNKKTIIDINSFYYDVDVVTGEIVEYPFEQLDEYQSMDMLTNGNDKIIVISKNTNGKLSTKEIFEDFLNNI